MKKLLLLLLLLPLLGSSQVMSHGAFVIFVNDTLSVESVSFCNNVRARDASNFMLYEERDIDHLGDSIYFSLTTERYFVYFPAVQTKFIVKSISAKSHNLGEHLLWLIERYRESPKLFACLE